MPEERSFISIGRSRGNANMALNSGKKPQKIAKKKRSPTCSFKITIMLGDKINGIYYYVGVVYIKANHIYTIADIDQYYYEPF